MAIDNDTKAVLLLNFHKSIEQPGFTLSCKISILLLSVQ